MVRTYNLIKYEIWVCDNKPKVGCYDLWDSNSDRCCCGSIHNTKLTLECSSIPKHKACSEISKPFDTVQPLKRV